MSTDRELMELAAKAAGIKGVWNSWRDQGGAEGSGIQHTSDAWRLWNPLDDDGDAFRLAVTLNMIVAVYDFYSEAVVCGAADEPHHEPKTVWHNGDAAASARRAIVRAAAEIGWAMP